MLLSTYGASLLENLLRGKGKLEQVKALLEQARTFNAASSFNKL